MICKQKGKQGRMTYSGANFGYNLDNLKLYLFLRILKSFRMQTGFGGCSE